MIDPAERHEAPMRQLTALYDAPVPAAAARRALAAAGFTDADVDVFTVHLDSPPPGVDAVRPRGDLATEIVLRSERLAADPAEGLLAAIAQALAARGVPSGHAGDIAGRVVAGRGWLVGVACPDGRADAARRALVGAAAVEVFVG